MTPLLYWLPAATLMASGEGLVLSCCAHRCPDSDFSRLASLDTLACVFTLTVCPLLVQIPPSFTRRHNVCTPSGKPSIRLLAADLCLALLTGSWPSHSTCHLLLCILVVWVSLTLGASTPLPRKEDPSPFSGFSPASSTRWALPFGETSAGGLWFASD